MLGHIELRTAKIWCEVTSGTKVELNYWSAQDPKSIKTAFKTQNKFLNFETVLFDLVELEPGTNYFYQIVQNNKLRLNAFAGNFATQELWQWRKPPPDFSFITGSCFYQNEPVYDRPGKPYGSDSTIILSMAKENSKFMLWLGDSWYTREVDYGSEWGLWYRASKDRSSEFLQPFLKSMSHYAIWDDHDFGPNNEGVSYIFKNESRNVFRSYFANPTYGMNNEGVYTKLSYNDIDLFLMDNRTWRSSDDMPTIIDGHWNPNKKMFGEEQLNWLQNALLNSTATFKIIVTGSQVLNELSTNDCMTHYPIEKKELLDFLTYSKVNGVLFITGDRHLSEINKLSRDSLYTLYDVTVSSLTAGISKIKKEEVDNPNRVPNTLIQEHNYARFNFTGNAKERLLTIEFMDKFGKNKSSFEISENDLKNKKKSKDK
ncbi:MAG: alkaline phosphatase D family protein [Saprospiraceae bacterium]